MFGFSIFLFIIPNLIWTPLSLIKCLLVIYGGKKLFKIEKDDFVKPSGSLIIPFFASWGIDLIMAPLSLIFMLVISGFVPFLSRVHSEFGWQGMGDYVAATIYVIMTLVIYAVFLLPIGFVLKQKIANDVKRKKLLRLFICSSIFIMAILGMMTIPLNDPGPPPVPYIPN